MRAGAAAIAVALPLHRLPPTHVSTEAGCVDAPGNPLTYDALDPRSVTLRLEFSIADAVAQRGLFPVLLAALRAWWSRPRLPPNLPAYLRVDVGLSPVESQIVYWMDIPINPHSVNAPDPLRRPGM